MKRDGIFIARVKVKLDKWNLNVVRSNFWPLVSFQIQFFRSSITCSCAEIFEQYKLMRLLGKKHKASNKQA